MKQVIGKARQGILMKQVIGKTDQSVCTVAEVTTVGRLTGASFGCGIGETNEAGNR